MLRLSMNSYQVRSECWPTHLVSCGACNHDHGLSGMVNGGRTFKNPHMGRSDGCDFRGFRPSLSPFSLRAR